MNWTNDSFLTGYSIINPIKRVRIFEFANAFMYRPNFTRSESDIDSLPNSDASSSRSLEIEFLRISSILCDLQIEQKSNRFLSIPKTQKKRMIVNLICSFGGVCKQLPCILSFPIEILKDHLSVLEMCVSQQ